MKHIVNTLMALSDTTPLIEFFDELNKHNDGLSEVATFHFKAKLQRWNEDNMHQRVLTFGEAFLEHYYNDTDVLALIADAHRQANDTVSAIKSYYRLKLHTDEPDKVQSISQLIYDLVHRYHQQLAQRQEWHTLLELYDYLIGTEPDYPYYFLNQAKLYLRLKDYFNANQSLAYILHDPILSAEAEKLSDTIARALTGHIPIPLHWSNDSYFVSVRLDDIVDLNLLIDTGASISAMSLHLFQTIKSKSQPQFIAMHRVSTANGTIKAPAYRFKHLTIGDQRISNVDFIIIDNLTAADGLLGMNVLKQFEFVIDQQQHILLLSPQ